MVETMGMRLAPADRVRMTHVAVINLQSQTQNVSRFVGGRPPICGFQCKPLTAAGDDAIFDHPRGTPHGARTLRHEAILTEGSRLSLHRSLNLVYPRAKPLKLGF